MRVDLLCFQVKSAYKVGVLYCKAGQVTEEDMYNNEHGSAAFHQFLDLIGQKVKLKGFDGFKGGLDVTSTCVKLDRILIVGKQTYLTFTLGVVACCLITICLFVQFVLDIVYFVITSFSNIFFDICQLYSSCFRAAIKLSKLN